LLKALLNCDAYYKIGDWIDDYGYGNENSKVHGLVQLNWIEEG